MIKKLINVSVFMIMIVALTGCEDITPSDEQQVAGAGESTASSYSQQQTESIGTDFSRSLGSAFGGG